MAGSVGAEAEAESLSPLFDVGLELVENCSGLLDTIKKHPGIELAKVTLAVLGLRLDLAKSEVRGKSWLLLNLSISFLCAQATVKVATRRIFP